MRGRRVHVQAVLLAALVSGLTGCATPRYEVAELASALAADGIRAGDVRFQGHVRYGRTAEFETRVPFFDAMLVVTDSAVVLYSDDNAGTELKADATIPIPAIDRAAVYRWGQGGRYQQLQLTQGAVVYGIFVEPPNSGVAGTREGTAAAVSALTGTGVEFEPPPTTSAANFIHVIMPDGLGGGFEF
ncbi:MAG: hypothetical protein KDE20_25195, partial [Caldilineaceae bacterium]|nr:hypothetical protein [Caldilineaceae bacterium]